MTAQIINTGVGRILAVYHTLKRPRPDARAFALRHLEEAVELALECGVSVKDAYISVDQAFRNEQDKHPWRAYDAEHRGCPMAIAGEIADVSLLARATAYVADVSDEMVAIAAEQKVDRVVDAAKNGTLYFTPDRAIIP